MKKGGKGILWSFLWLLCVKMINAKPTEPYDLRAIPGHNLLAPQETASTLQPGAPQTKPAIESLNVPEGVTFLTTEVPYNVFESSTGHKEIPPEIRDYDKRTADLKIRLMIDTGEKSETLLPFEVPDGYEASIFERKEENKTKGLTQLNEEHFPSTISTMIDFTSSDELTSLESIFTQASSNTFSYEETLPFDSSIEDLSDIFNEDVVKSEESKGIIPVTEMEGSGFLGGTGEEIWEETGERRNVVNEGTLQLEGFGEIEEGSGEDTFVPNEKSKISNDGKLLDDFSSEIGLKDVSRRKGKTGFIIDSTNKQNVINNKGEEPQFEENHVRDEILKSITDVSENVPKEGNSANEEKTNKTDRSKNGKIPRKLEFLFEEVRELKQEIKPVTHETRKIEENLHSEKKSFVLNTITKDNATRTLPKLNLVLEEIEESTVKNKEIPPITPNIETIIKPVEENLVYQLETFPNISEEEIKDLTDQNEEKSNITLEEIEESTVEYKEIPPITPNIETIIKPVEENLVYQLETFPNTSEEEIKDLTDQNKEKPNIISEEIEESTVEYKEIAQITRNIETINKPVEENLVHHIEPLAHITQEEIEDLTDQNEDYTNLSSNSTTENEYTTTNSKQDHEFGDIIPLRQETEENFTNQNFLLPSNSTIKDENIRIISTLDYVTEETNDSTNKGEDIIQITTTRSEINLKPVEENIVLHREVLINPKDDQDEGFTQKNEDMTQIASTIEAIDENSIFHSEMSNINDEVKEVLNIDSATNSLLEEANKLTEKEGETTEELNLKNKEIETQNVVINKEAPSSIKTHKLGVITEEFPTPGGTTLRNEESVEEEITDDKKNYNENLKLFTTENSESAVKPGEIDSGAPNNQELIKQLEENLPLEETTPNSSNLEDYNLNMKDYNIETNDYNTETNDYNTEINDYNTETNDYNTETKDYSTEVKDFNTKPADGSHQINTDLDFSLRDIEETSQSNEETSKLDQFLEQIGANIVIEENQIKKSNQENVSTQNIEEIPEATGPMNTNNFEAITEKFSPRKETMIPNEDILTEEMNNNTKHIGKYVINSVILKENEETSLNGEETNLNSEETILKVKDRNLKGGETNLKAEETNLKAEETNLKAEETNLKTEEANPKPEKTTPQSEETNQQYEETTPQSEETTPQSEEMNLKTDKSNTKTKETKLKNNKETVENKGFEKQIEENMTETINNTLTKDEKIEEIIQEISQFNQFLEQLQENIHLEDNQIKNMSNNDVFIQKNDESTEEISKEIEEYAISKEIHSNSTYDKNETFGNSTNSANNISIEKHQGLVEQIEEYATFLIDNQPEVLPSLESGENMLTTTEPKNNLINNNMVKNISNASRIKNEETSIHISKEFEENFATTEINHHFKGTVDDILQEIIPNVSPFVETHTQDSTTEDEWLKIINSSPEDKERYEEEVLDLVDELLGLNVDSDATVLKDNKSYKAELFDTTMNPFEGTESQGEEESTITSQGKSSDSITIQKITGNGNFNSKNISLIENEEIANSSKEHFEIKPNVDGNEETSKSINVPKIKQFDSLIVDQIKEGTLEDHLMKLWPNLKEKEKKALEALVKEIDVATLAHYDLNYLLNQAQSYQKTSLEQSQVVTKTFGHAFLRAGEINENVEVCFAGTIGYQFVVKTNEEIESPKYFAEFNKVCVRTYEPILIIQQESSFVEFKFKVSHDVITLQRLHININGKSEIDGYFIKNLTVFDALIGTDIVVDELKLENLQKHHVETNELTLKLFNVNLTTEMYINGKLIDEYEETAEENVTTIIISASVGVFCVFFFVIFVLIYQFCLKNKSRKMIYILTQR